jgi:hypothetical protein
VLGLSILAGVIPSTGAGDISAGVIPSTGAGMIPAGVTPSMGAGACMFILLHLILFLVQE